MKLLRTLERGKAGKTPSRRQLLKALGVAAAAAPLSRRWTAGRRAARPPQRLLLLFAPDGIVPDQWWPTGTETAWNFPAGRHLRAARTATRRT